MAIYAPVSQFRCGKQGGLQWSNNAGVGVAQPSQQQPARVTPLQAELRTAFTKAMKDLSANTTVGQRADWKGQGGVRTYTSATCGDYFLSTASMYAAINTLRFWKVGTPNRDAQLAAGGNVQCNVISAVPAGTSLRCTFQTGLPNRPMAWILFFLRPANQPATEAWRNHWRFAAITTIRPTFVDPSVIDLVSPWPGVDGSACEVRITGLRMDNQMKVGGLFI